MTDDLWEEAFECARRAEKLNELLRGVFIGEADRKHLEKTFAELKQRATLLKARASASAGSQNSPTRKRRLRGRAGP